MLKLFCHEGIVVTGHALHLLDIGVYSAPIYAFMKAKDDELSLLTILNEKGSLCVSYSRLKVMNL